MAKKKPKKTKKPKPAPKPEGEEGPSPRRFRHSLENAPEKSPAEEHYAGEGEQMELLKLPEKPPPPSIVDGRIAMHFLSYKVTRTEERNLEVSLNFTLDLVKDHEGHLPQEIESAWKDLEDKHYNGVEPPYDDGEQSLELTLDPAISPLLISALLETVYIEKIQERGKGKNREITRLTLRFLCDMTDDVDQFCRNALDETVFAKIEAAQKTLREEG